MLAVVLHDLMCQVCSLRVGPSLPQLALASSNLSRGYSNRNTVARYAVAALKRVWHRAYSVIAQP